MILFLIGLIGFLGIHSIHALLPGVRAAAIAKLGEMPWKGLYALLSLVFFILMIFGYPGALVTGMDWAYFGEPPTPLKHLNSLLIPVALILAVAGSLPAGHIAKTLKHPQLVGVKLWALGHLLANWDAFSFIFFGGFLAWAVLVRISIKRRPASPPKAPKLLFDGIAVIAGLAISGWMIMGGHQHLFGVPPIPGM